MESGLCAGIVAGVVGVGLQGHVDSNFTGRSDLQDSWFCSAFHDHRISAFKPYDSSEFFVDGIQFVLKYEFSVPCVFAGAVCNGNEYIAIWQYKSVT